jgi:hypothetical protein
MKTVIILLRIRRMSVILELKRGRDPTAPVATLVETFEIKFRGSSAGTIRILVSPGVYGRIFDTRKPTADHRK